MGKNIALILFLITIASCGGNQTGNGTAQDHVAPIASAQLLKSMLEKGVTEDVSGMLDGTWKLTSYPLSNAPAITQDVNVNFNSGSLDEFSAPPLFNFEEKTYVPPTNNVEWITNIPPNSKSYGGVYEATLNYEVIQTGFDQILKITISGKDYNSCGSNEIGGCAKSGFVPTSFPVSRSYSFVIKGSLQNAFVVQAEGYYVVFIKKTNI